MKYELAEQLSKSGFPQGRGGFYKNVEGTIFHHADTVCSSYHDCVYFPSLAELIEECQEGLRSLNNYGKYWTAINCDIGSSMFERGEYIQQSGATPEEAVSNLWLALHRKAV